MALIVRDHFREIGEQFVVETRLLASEPIRPPVDPKERKAWEARIRTRRATIRRAMAELADLAMIVAVVEEHGLP